MEEKYYRNICSLPTTLRNIVNLKIATNKNDSLAVIEFYDAVDCRDKLWIFTEKEEKFEEHCDPKSEPCKQCKDDPLNSNLVCRKRNHSSHFSCKKQILRIQWLTYHLCDWYMIYSITNCSLCNIQNEINSEMYKYISCTNYILYQ